MRVLRNCLALVCSFLICVLLEVLYTVDFLHKPSVGQTRQEKHFGVDEIIRRKTETQRKVAAMTSVKEEDHQAIENKINLRKQQEKRQAGLNTSCWRRRASRTTPFPNKWIDNILVDPHHKFLYCMVPKAGSTNMKRHLLLLNPRVPDLTVEKKTQKLIDMKYRSPSAFVHGLEVLKMAGYKFLEDYSKNKREQMLREYFSFLVVRDPWARLLSAYRDKLEKNDSVIVRSFHRTLGTKILRKYRPHASIQDLRTGSGVTFEEFLQYVVHTQPAFMDSHWRPIHKLCNPCKVRYKYIAKLETIETDTGIIVQKIYNKNATFSFPAKHFGPVSSNIEDKQTSTNKLLKYYSKIDKNLLSRIHDVYSFDFDLFGYQHWVLK